MPCFESIASLTVTMAGDFHFKVLRHKHLLGIAQRTVHVALSVNCYDIIKPINLLICSVINLLSAPA